MHVSRSCLETAQSFSNGVQPPACAPTRWNISLKAPLGRPINLDESWGRTSAPQPPKAVPIFG